ncbi:peptidoglycan-binding protein [Paractinoplanes globisporus]|uniref:Peptidoglycan-binding protein n=1 Tax=Paractinoplanes globisporus TaxID=113565 RepID=A0ABW6W785_9ACTN|nr:peptidoglycan-binding protein [Actinoplanes globisporus]
MTTQEIPRRPRRPRRWLFVLAAVVTAVLLVGGGVVAGRQFRSPEQAAADARPPAPSLITAVAEQRVLAEPVTLRGQMKPGPKVNLPAPAAAVGPDSVVTEVAVEAGDRLAEGTRVLDVSGQPMFTLGLPFPLWRDLTGGMKGPDVGEIQQALRRLGYYVPRSDTLDEPTQRALARFYRRLGYDPVGGDPRAAEQIPAANRELAAARAAVPAAQARVDEAQRQLDALTLAAGAGLPRRCVLRMDKADRKVTAVRVKVGAVLTDPGKPILELDGQKPYLSAVATERQVQLIKAGQRVKVSDESSGTEADGMVASVATTAATGADKESGYEVRVSLAGSDLGAAAGGSLRIDIAVSTGDDEVLAVPVTAVYARADGSMFATVLAGDGSTRDVTVETGGIAGGWVEVRPGHDGDIVAGTKVVVGANGPVN